MIFKYYSQGPTYQTTLDSDHNSNRCCISRGYEPKHTVEPSTEITFEFELSTASEDSRAQPF